MRIVLLYIILFIYLNISAQDNAEIMFNYGVPKTIYSAVKINETSILLNNHLVFDILQKRVIKKLVGDEIFIKSDNSESHLHSISYAHKNNYLHKWGAIKSKYVLYKWDQNTLKKSDSIYFEYSFLPLRDVYQKIKLTNDTILSVRVNRKYKHCYYDYAVELNLKTSKIDEQSAQELIAHIESYLSVQKQQKTAYYIVDYLENIQGANKLVRISERNAFMNVCQVKSVQLLDTMSQYEYKLSPGAKWVVDLKGHVIHRDKNTTYQMPDDYNALQSHVWINDSCFISKAFSGSYEYLLYNQLHKNLIVTDTIYRRSNITSVQYFDFFVTVSNQVLVIIDEGILRVTNITKKEIVNQTMEKSLVQPFLFKYFAQINPTNKANPYRLDYAYNPERSNSIIILDNECATVKNINLSDFINFPYASQSIQLSDYKLNMTNPNIKSGFTHLHNGIVLLEFKRTMQPIASESSAKQDVDSTLYIVYNHFSPESSFSFFVTSAYFRSGVSNYWYDEHKQQIGIIGFGVNSNKPIVAYVSKSNNHINQDNISHTLMDYEQKNGLIKYMLLVNSQNSGEKTVPEMNMQIKSRFVVGKRKNASTRFVWDYITDTINDIHDSVSIEELLKPIHSMSPDLKHFITNNQLYSCSNSAAIRTIPFAFESARFMNDTIFYIIQQDGGLRFWNVNNDSSYFVYHALNDSDWVAQTDNGLFDATPNAMHDMYFIYQNNVIEFEQLKELYYEPWLIDKLLGVNAEPLRKVSQISGFKLFPSVQSRIIDSLGETYLYILLTNQGGGIGKVSLLINGKEAIEDIRPEGFDVHANTAFLSKNLSQLPFFVCGTQNKIEIQTWNLENYIHSRGAIIRYACKDEAIPNAPRLFVLSIGTSDYEGKDIDLRYATKDAQSVSKALELGGKKLFGNYGVTIVDINSSLLNNRPTKSNIIQAFKSLKDSCKPSDILVVYMSGHGINVGGEEGDFYYLSEEAYSANPVMLKDTKIRESFSIGSRELTALTNQIPALKQVLIIDACGSGKAVDNLLSARDIESSTLRALERMKDRTGMHIIAGCAADAVSFEASRYGQGFLTYAILEGIKGAALREDKFLDVNQLFQYARERVPKLAKESGVVQEPRVFSPYGSESFDIGLMTDETKKAVPLSFPKPLFVRSNFQDEEYLEDYLDLSKKVDIILSDISSRGYDAPLVFIDTKEFTEAVKLTGLYKKTQSGFMLRLKVKSKKESSIIHIHAQSIDGLAEKVKLEIEKIIK